MHRCPHTVAPAKAGAHLSAGTILEAQLATTTPAARWVPTFAGTTVLGIPLH
jgi:hypothetical protein